MSSYKTTGALMVGGKPAAPDVSSVPCNLKASYKTGLERGESDGTSKHFSHIMLVDFPTDVRDDWNADSVGGNADTVYVPNKNGTAFKVAPAPEMSPAQAQLALAATTAAQRKDRRIIDASRIVVELASGHRSSARRTERHTYRRRPTCLYDAQATGR